MTSFRRLCYRRAHAYLPTTTLKIMWGCNVLEHALAACATHDFVPWSPGCIRSWGLKRVEQALVCYRHVVDGNAYWLQSDRDGIVDRQAPGAAKSRACVLGSRWIVKDCLMANTTVRWHVLRSNTS